MSEQKVQGLLAFILALLNFEAGLRCSTLLLLEHLLLPLEIRGLLRVCFTGVQHLIHVVEMRFR